MLTPMKDENIEAAVSLISAAMNPTEAKWADKGMRAHFKAVTVGIDDGRLYFMYRKTGSVAGIAGLHHYSWGPDENVWLAWFAVAPSMQRHGIGRAMMNEMLALSRKRGFRKFFIETYDHPDFVGAQAFYRAMGFERRGHIENYLPNGAAMAVFMKTLE
jgi:ribosomal protein S18 acetylase RimI-like enzyme